MSQDPPAPQCGTNRAARAGTARAERAPRNALAFLRVVGFLAASLVAFPSFAQWSKVGVGIEYRAFRVNGENDAFVTRLDRKESRAILDTAIAKDSLASGRETVSSMAARTNGTVGYWGESDAKPYTVVAAINGDFFDLTTGVPESGQIVGGWYAKRFNDVTAYSGFVWKLDRTVFLGECVKHDKNKQLVRYGATGPTQPLAGLNRARKDNELVVYTRHWATTTGTAATGSEVRVRLDRPALIVPSPNGVSGKVLEVRRNQGNTPLGPNEVVLSASGNAATTLLAQATVGQTVQLSQEVSAFDPSCKQAGGVDWSKAYASLGGNWIFLKGGVVQDLSAKQGAVIVNPRTAIAYNADYVFFVVVDGRSARSKGMNMAELGAFCKDELQATDGINQDGGGSSTLWVNGTVKNVPSDGAERPVANAIMMITVPGAAGTPDGGPTADLSAPVGDAYIDGSPRPTDGGSSSGGGDHVTGEAGAGSPASGGGCGCDATTPGGPLYPEARLVPALLALLLGAALRGAGKRRGSRNGDRR
ncbi:MAG: phosphodiester glycosidase family protein [Deltaproteobacteria bacterium]|nr:phosphodiester glycosidase family protein [Deltaproteobacteria bacterium]